MPLVVGATPTVRCPFHGLHYSLKLWSSLRYAHLRSSFPQSGRLVSRNEVHAAQPIHRADPFWPAASTARSCRTLGLSENPEPFIECRDFRFIEPSSECKRRIRLRHVATGSDLVAMLVRVSSRLRLRVA